MAEPDEKPGLHPELQTYMERIEQARKDVKVIVDGLTEEQFNWRSEPKRWSIGECLEHLLKSGNKFLPNIENKVEEAGEERTFGQGPFKHGKLGNWFLAVGGGEELPPKRRFKAPSFARPGTSQELDDTVRRFLEFQDRFAGLVEKANGLDLARVKLPSPMPLMRFSLGQWLALVSGHQTRHLWQARQVREHPEFPK